MSGSEEASMKPDGDPLDGHGNGELPNDLKAVEAVLAALRPTAVRLDRERLMFLAGQASTSVADERPSYVFGLPVNHRAWPAAFAGMTAVAVALLVLLVARPPTTPGIALTDRSPSGERSTMPQNLAPDRARKMATSDAYAQDIERLLATKGALAGGGGAALGSPSLDTAERIILTPAAWHQVIDRTAVKPSDNDSSYLPALRGTES